MNRPAFGDVTPSHHPTRLMRSLSTCLLIRRYPTSRCLLGHRWQPTHSADGAPAFNAIVGDGVTLSHSTGPRVVRGTLTHTNVYDYVPIVNGRSDIFWRYVRGADTSTPFLRSKHVIRG